MAIISPQKRSVVFADAAREEDDSSFSADALTSSFPFPSPSSSSSSSSSSSVTQTIIKTSSSATALTHLQNSWPGKTGNGRHLDVRPMSFGELLSGRKIVVPIFQRRYCWTRAQISRWWRDVSKGEAGQQHTTHKTMFKKIREGTTAAGDTTLICIDGQQRLTTTTILLMAVRAEARHQNKVDGGDGNNTARSIDAVLLPSGDAVAGMKRWAKYTALRLIRNSEHRPDGAAYVFTMPSLPSGWLPPFDTVLVPSYIDRAAYFELLCADHVLEALEEALSATNSKPVRVELKLSPACEDSIQRAAFGIFATELKSLSASARTSSLADSALDRLRQNQLVGFSLVYIELLTNDDAQQIFLWMQEKSVFGMGRLLYNAHPGMDFEPIDLARNLVASSVANEASREQTRLYRAIWIDPLEGRFGTAGASRILHRLVDCVAAEKRHYVGDMERRLEQLEAAVPAHFRDAFSADSPMMVYARYHSYVQQRAMQLENGNPNAISRAVVDSIVREMVTVGESIGL